MKNWYVKMIYDRNKTYKIYKLKFLRGDIMEKRGKIEEGYLPCTEEEGNNLIKFLKFFPVQALCGNGFAEFKYYP